MSISKEFWAIVTVGVAVLGLGWQAYSRLDTRIDALQTDVATIKVDVASVKERLAHIEGWIQGRFREGETQ